MQKTTTILIAKIKVGRFFDVPSWVHFFLQSLFSFVFFSTSAGFYCSGTLLSIYVLMDNEKHTQIRFLS